MTIKRRIFWSNVLMVIIPILLSIIFATLITNLVLDRLGIADPSHKNTNSYYHTIRMIQDHSTKWTKSNSPDLIINEISEWGLSADDEIITCAIYRDQEQISTLGKFEENQLVKIALDTPKNRFFTVDHMSLYTISLGDYRLYLLNQEYQYNESALIDENNKSFFYGGGIMLMFIGCIMITNWSLTHLVFKSIIVPLEILVDGVHQISSGDLSFRLHYKGKDEFAEVCNDFNDMAEQIEKLIEARRKDDENRRELIAGISHDLRTPLTSIKAYVEGLTAGVAATPAIQKEYLDIITAKTNDLDHLIGQLFQFSKLDVGEFPFSLEYLDIGAVISNYVGTVRKEYEERGLTLIQQNGEAGIIVYADVVQLHNVFTNFLENSLKYGATENSLSRISYRKAGQQVEISFTDNGPGVPEAQLSKLFLVFYRGDKARHAPGQSSGLGLAISDKLVRGLGGSLRAENIPDGGLRMIISLPTAKIERDYQ